MKSMMNEEVLPIFKRRLRNELLWLRFLLLAGWVSARVASAQTHTQEFPENPLGYNGHLSDTGTHSTDAGTHSTDTGTHSTDTGTLATDLVGTHSTQTTGLSAETVPSFVRWTARVDGPGNFPAGLVVSPDGSRVFITGSHVGVDDDTDILTIAYDSDTGAAIWAQRYDGPSSGIGDSDGPGSIAISPDGLRIYVAGGSVSSGHYDGLIIAYDSFSGTPIWTRRYLASASAASSLGHIVISPEGAIIYMAGGVAGDLLTVACNSSDGSLVWAKRYDGPASSTDAARVLLLSPDGTKLYVIGESVAAGGPSDFDYLTIAYNAIDGSVIWAKRYDGPSTLGEQPAAAMLSPGGEALYVTGISQVPGFTTDYLTIAYGTSTGAPIWTKRYDGPAPGDDESLSLAISPDGSKVLVCGRSPAAATGPDYLSIAHNSVDGGNERGDEVGARG